MQRPPPVLAGMSRIVTEKVPLRDRDQQQPASAQSRRVVHTKDGKSSIISGPSDSARLQECSDELSVSATPDVDKAPETSRKDHD